MIRLILISSLLLIPAQLAARTWEVREDGSGHATTIQAGIDSAAAGDTVLVHPGTYAEHIDFKGKDIVVRSAMGPNGTTLDGSDAVGHVVLLQPGETRAAVLEGFTITGGSSGVSIFNSEPSILGNVITENSGAFSGAGIWCAAQPFDLVPTFRPLIKNNTITRNTAERIGGGIGTWQRMAPEVIDNYIAENEATDGDGGGVYFRALPDDTGAIFRGNTIENNYAGDHGGGFYAAAVGLPGTIKFEFSWNLVRGNTADGFEDTGNSGGGVWLWESDAWIHHNTIVENTGNGPDSTYGGGIVAEKPSSPMIEKNIIALSQNGGGIWCGGGATPTIRNNLAWQNLPSEGVGDCADWWSTNGNVIADPNFCDAEGGDFSLAQNSPAITHFAGPFGAVPIPGCGPVSVNRTTWGRIKTLYR